MLEAALKDGIVSAFDDIQEHVAHLASIRDFPLFEGDFFPDHLKVMLAPPAPSRGGGPPMLCRESSSALAASLKNKTKAMRKRQGSLGRTPSTRIKKQIGHGMTSILGLYSRGGAKCQ